MIFLLLLLVFFKVDVIIQRAAPYSCVSGVTSAPSVPCAHRALPRRCSSARGGLPDRGRATSVGSVHPFKQPHHHHPLQMALLGFLCSVRRGRNMISITAGSQELSDARRSLALLCRPRGCVLVSDARSRTSPLSVRCGQIQS